VKIHTAIFMLTLACPSTGICQTIGLVPGTTQPRIQLTGENFQLFSNGVYFTDFVPGRSLTTSGLVGTDLGSPVVYPDKILFLFGDTLSAYPAGSAYYFASGSGGDDGMGFIPNTDFSQCHYVTDVDQQILQGNRSPSVSPGACPALQVYNNPQAGPTDHRYMKISIAGLQPDESTAQFETPSGAFDLDGQLYMFYIVQQQAGSPHFALRSIMAKADQPSSAWNSSTPPSFTRLYIVSSHPPVADPNNPPPEAGDFGKFMFNSPVVLDRSVFGAFGIGQLPSALQGASRLVFVFGSSWRYDRSNLYLAVFSADDVTSGTSKWFYYTGQNTSGSWSQDESAATPLIPGLDMVGNHSVVWNPALQRFILMFGHTIVARFAPAPWSTWSDALPILGPQSDWAMKLIHHPGQDPIRRSLVPIYNPASGQSMNLDNNATGVPYAPYLIDKYTSNPDGSVTVYYALSTWNPYQVFLMSSNFVVGSPAISSSQAALPQIAFGGGWYTALYLYNGNNVPVTTGLQLNDQSGEPLTIPFAGRAATTVGLPPHGTAILEFPDRGSLQQGWASLSLADGVSGYGVFRQRVAGRPDQEAVVPITMANASQNSLIFDDTAYQTAIAFADPSTFSGTATLTARDDTGQVLGSAGTGLVADSSRAVLLRDVIPAVAGKRGSLQMNVIPGALSLMGLRFNTSAFTTIPTGAQAVSNGTAALPQVAFGGGWYTALYFYNTGDTPATIALSFFDGNGDPLGVPPSGNANQTLTISAHGTVTLEMPNTGDLEQGWARVALASGVIGYGVFRQSVEGRPDQEAVVPLTDTRSSASTIIYDDTLYTTAIAIANPTGSSNSVSVTALDDTGQTVGTTTVTLAPYARQAVVLRDLTPAIAGGRGSVRFTASTGAVSVLGLRFNTSAFTSIPADTN
jgi:hypothetical protein